MIMRPPQHGQGVGGPLGPVTSALAGSRWGFGPASSSRARAMDEEIEGGLFNNRLSALSVYLCRS